MFNDLGANRARIIEIEAQILDLECSLSALRAEKTLVQEWLNSYKYPVLALPNEIISEIFFHFLPYHPLCPPLTGILSPTTLTQICRHWREVALATPALWRAIQLSADDIVFGRDNIADIWLARSRSLPLSIDINECFVPTPEILSPIVHHRARWENLKLHLFGPHLHTIEGPMPLLRHLDLSLYTPIDIPVTFREAPRLCTVVLNDLAATSINLPWGQLTSLTLGYMTARKCAVILQQTSSLVHCELNLRGHNTDSNHWQPQPHIILPCLESLAFGLGSDPRTRILDTLVVPSLRSLHLPEEFLGTNPITSLTAFISKSGCKLQEVHITGERTIPEDSYRHAFPSIPQFSFAKLWFLECWDF
ncbi:hypothetical protein B0H13DRAFT_2288921 [Mycena leptocephala]|nr:hypothetical protein B0H13DRAFT_2288921 [Mycena leptocephala]